MSITRATTLTLIIVIATATFAVAGSPPAIQGIERIVEGPSALDLFRRPKGLAVDAERDIVLVADTGNNRIVILDSTGRSRGVISYAKGSGDVSIGEPKALSIGPRGRVFVIDGLNPGLEIMTPRGSHLGRLDHGPEETLDKGVPQDVAVGQSGRIYLLCGGDAPGVMILDDRAAVLRWIDFARVEFDIRSPVAMAVSQDETRLAVVDSDGPYSVHVLAEDGKPLVSFGQHQEGEDTFSLAVDVAWGPEQTLWVTDTMRHSISVFSSRGEYQSRIGGFGHGPGQFNYPVACAFLRDDRVLVLERANARLQVLEVNAPGSPNSGSHLERNRSDLSEHF